jgi:D-alanine-D-alanine ligase
MKVNGTETMKSSDKIRVAVLYGGRSAEHEISLISASNVIQQLDRTQFDVLPLGIDKQGSWYLGTEVFDKSLQHKQVSRLHDDSHAWFAPAWIGNPSEKQQLTELSLSANNGPHFDVVFPVVHGTLCEDGTLQGLLEMANLPYVGCGVLSSAVNMDKDVSKRLAQNANIPIAPYLTVKHGQWQKAADQISKHVSDKIGFPVFVKPCNTGSSIGVSKVKSAGELTAAVEEAFRFDRKIVIEKGLNVLELEVAVLESLDDEDEPFVSIVGEIRSRHEFYSYEAKYLDENGAELFIPASVSDDIKEQARQIAKKLFIALECEGMARVDLFYDKDAKQIVFNEINTIPGFTQISMYPKLMVASGLTYTNLLTHLIKLAMKKHQHKSKLIRSYADQ